MHNKYPPTSVRSFRSLFWRQFLKLLPAPEMQPVFSGLNVDEKKTSTILIPAIRMRLISRDSGFRYAFTCSHNRSGELVINPPQEVNRRGWRKPKQPCKLPGLPCCHLAWITHLKGLKPCSHYATSGSNAVASVQRGVGLLVQGLLNDLHLFEIYTNCKHDAIKSKSWLLLLRFSWTPSANRGTEMTEYVLTFCCHYLHLYWAFFAQGCCVPKGSIFEQPHTSKRPVLILYHNL